MARRILISLMLTVVFWGCEESARRIKIQYDQIQGLKEGDRVIFEQNHIGEITSVFYLADGYYTVDLAIKTHFANAVTEHSKFFIIGDPENEAKKAIEMIQTRRGGLPLQDGAIVQGSSKSSAVFSQMKEDLEKGLGDVKEQFERLFEELRNVPESEELKKLEKRLERLAEEMKRSSKSAREKMQKELLPRLKEEMEKLREQLEKFGREEELEPLETKMEEIMEI
jgi:paraquat-inducible protein B